MEDDNDKTDNFLPPIHTNTFGIPNDHDLRMAYIVCKPSRETRMLKSEQGRKLFAEAFIEDERLGTLSDLCVRALAKAHGMEDMLPIVTGDPLKMRIHYDSLSIDLPLLQCYEITDEMYWKRVVLAKHKDKSLAFKKNYNWKNVGIALKLVEIVEACPAEYWPEEEMQALALKIREYITELHISKLQSLQERSFEEYYESDENLSDESSEISSDHSTSQESIQPVISTVLSVQKTEEELQLEAQMAAEKAQQKALARAVRREEKEEKRAAKEARRLKREEQRAIELAKLAPKSKKKPKIKDVLSIQVSEDEDDGENEKEDRRNLEKHLRRKKKYKYPPEHCHHIDLRFLRDYIYLTSLTIEFLGPDQGRDYHTKHFNFSYKDMEHLAFALQHLILLKTFRLINSRMDARKMEIILKALENLSELEFLDLSNDQLRDDCGQSLYDFFVSSKSLKRLELRGNDLDTQVLEKLAEGLREYEGVLDYLGLANNTLGYEGFHKLINSLFDTEHIKELNLRGAHVEQYTIICCIAEELIAQHKILEKLDLAAIHMGPEAGVALIKALALSRSLMDLDCRGCDLSFDIEFEADLCIQRNRYIVENPYIGDDTKTEQEIMEYVNRVKNPILLHALAEVEKRNTCRKNQPDEYDRFAVTPTEDSPEALDAEHDLVFYMGYSIDAKGKEAAEISSESDAGSDITVGPFVYNPNEFDEEQFMQHVYIPGPNERYYYFKQKRGLKDAMSTIEE